MIDVIHIPNLTHKLDKRITIEFQENLQDLATLVPVKGVAKVTHCGNYLLVEAEAQTIITLCCDRCLQQYNHRLSIDTEEMIWLTEAELDLDNLPLDEDLLLEEMVETMPQDGNFPIGNWVYEQMCLALPQRKLCDADCEGIAIVKSAADQVDRRWAGLEALRGQLPNN
jgi:uncharacterized protein